jgi:SAM-dependent methyltransferase
MAGVPGEKRRVLCSLLILDATCGKRGIWFNKQCKDCVYLDIRKEVKPDILADDTALPFRDNIFNIIVFDPPHTSMGPKSIMGKLYGRFTLARIKDTVARGATEFYRVLKNDGILLFKWNTHDISLGKVLSLMSIYFEPLFGQRVAYRTKHSSKTYWVCLVKKAKIEQKRLI